MRWFSVLSAVLIVSVVGCERGPPDGHGASLRSSKYAKEEAILQRQFVAMSPITATFTGACVQLAYAQTIDGVIGKALDNSGNVFVAVRFAGARGPIDGGPDWHRSLYHWLTKHGWATLDDVSREWKCLKLTPKGAKLFDGAGSPHIAATREITRWTFENEYKLGPITIFAATFEYVFKPRVPGLTFTGEGKGRFKIGLNPDTGIWQMMEYHIGDPQIVVHP